MSWSRLLAVDGIGWRASKVRSIIISSFVLSIACSEAITAHAMPEDAGDDGIGSIPGCISMAGSKDRKQKSMDDELESMILVKGLCEKRC